VTLEKWLTACLQYLTLREQAKVLTVRDLLGQGVSDMCSGFSLVLKQGLSHFALDNGVTLTLIDAAALVVSAVAS
jgi:hypothetical protein